MIKKALYLLVILFLLMVAYGFGKSQTQTPDDKNGTPFTNKNTERWLCTRAMPYEVPPELSRALSLALERLFAIPNPNAKIPRGSTNNCYHITYKDHAQMGNAEGYFLFDTNSDPNDLRIFVDNTYQNYDDILTASLISHEVTHAFQLLLTIKEKQDDLTCIEKEVNAFHSQIVFLANLNEEEWKSITYRVSKNPNLNSAYQLTDYLLKLNVQANAKCPNDPNQICWDNYVTTNLRDWIKSNQFYQKECNL